MPRLPIHGFVLAGGRSSRMGADKALLRLSGKPLIEHAVVKLSRMCEHVSVLGSREDLASYAALVPDLHPGCGPIGGIEAALQAATRPWSLVLPVDVPFVPTALLRMWAQATLTHGERLGTRLSMWTVGGRPQPALAMLHAGLLPFVETAIGRRHFKLLPMLEDAATGLSEQSGMTPGAASMARTLWAAEAEFAFGKPEQSFPQPEHLLETWSCLTEAQRQAKAMWFANLNTPASFAEAERFGAALDT